MNYLKKSFSVAPGSGASDENWERTFGKKKRYKKPHLCRQSSRLMQWRIELLGVKDVSAS